MKITEVSMSLGHTKNMGNYESLRIDIEVKSQVMEDQSVEEVFNEMHTYLQREVQKRIDLEVAHAHGDLQMAGASLGSAAPNAKGKPVEKPNIKPSNFKPRR